MTRHGSHTESRMRENCTYGSMRGRAFPTGRPALLYTPLYSQHHFSETPVFVGCGVRAVGTNESNTYRRTQREKRFFGVAINTHEHWHTSEHNRRV